MPKNTTTKEPEPSPAPTNGLEGFEARMLRRAAEFYENPETYQAEMEKEGGNPITLGPRVVDPTAWAEDQVAAAKAKGQKWLDRSKRPKKVPSEAALAAKDKYKNRLQESLDGDYWSKAMALVDEDLRMQIIEAVGATGFSTGVEKHKPKVVAKVKKLQPLVLALAQELDAMPTATDSDREAKMLAARRGMIAIGKAMKGA